MYLFCLFREVLKTHYAIGPKLKSLRLHYFLVKPYTYLRHRQKDYKPRHNCDAENIPNYNLSLIWGECLQVFLSMSQQLIDLLLHKYVQICAFFRTYQKKKGRPSRGALSIQPKSIFNQKTCCDYSVG